jgi:hypothetical protein
MANPPPFTGFSIDFVPPNFDIPRLFRIQEDGTVTLLYYDAEKAQVLTLDEYLSNTQDEDITTSSKFVVQHEDGRKEIFPPGVPVSDEWKAYAVMKETWRFQMLFTRAKEYTAALLPCSGF